MKTPKSGERVAVVVPGTGRVLARVSDVGKGYLKLDFGKRAKDAPKLKREDDAMLLFAGGQGVTELRGALRKEGLASSAFRFEFDAPKSDVQRRRHVRVDAQLPVIMRIQQVDARLVRSHTLNVSGGGLEVADTIGLPVGAMVKIELRLPGEEMPLPLSGKIVRRARPNTKGVKIERILSADQDRLVKFIFTRQRLELQAKQR